MAKAFDYVADVVLGETTSTLEKKAANAVFVTKVKKGFASEIASMDFLDPEQRKELSKILTRRPFIRKVCKGESLDLQAMPGKASRDSALLKLDQCSWEKVEKCLGSALVDLARQQISPALGLEFDDIGSRIDSVPEQIVHLLNAEKFNARKPPEPTEPDGTVPDEFPFVLEYRDPGGPHDVLTRHHDGSIGPASLATFACVVGEPSMETRNTLLRWHAAGANTPFCVILDDKRIENLEARVATFTQKMDEGEELDDLETFTYNAASCILGSLRKEGDIKKKAVEIFLRDRVFQAACFMSDANTLLEFSTHILNTPLPSYRAESIGPDDNEVAYDVWLDRTKSFKGGRFKAYLRADRVDAALENDPLLRVRSFVLDWMEVDQGIFQEIAAQYYVGYVGWEIVERGRHELGDDSYLNDLRTGIRAWSIGPG